MYKITLLGLAFRNKIKNRKIGSLKIENWKNGKSIGTYSSHDLAEYYPCCSDSLFKFGFLLIAGDHFHQDRIESAHFYLHVYTLQIYEFFFLKIG